MTLEDHLKSYITELTTIRTALEFEVIRLRKELESALGIKSSTASQSGSSPATSPSVPAEVHTPSTPPASPGPVSQGSNTVVDAGRIQVASAGTPTS